MAACSAHRPSSWCLFGNRRVKRRRLHPLDIILPPRTMTAPTRNGSVLLLAFFSADLRKLVVAICYKPYTNKILTFGLSYVRVRSMEKTLRIAIGVPSLDMIHTDFMMSLIGTSMDLKSKPIPGYDGGTFVTIVNKRSSVIAQLREDIVEEAKKAKATHLLWVDSDQMFPTDTARTLIAHDKDVVACNIAVKRIPSLPTARKFTPQYPLVGDIVYTKPESTGLEQIWKIGCGVMLEKMSVFERIEPPYFRFDYNPETKSVGEDWWHCELLRKAGIEIWIDHDLSKKVGHLGMYSHTMDDVDPTETKIKIVRPGEVAPR